jgi:hypothetical protein
VAMVRKAGGGLWSRNAVKASVLAARYGLLPLW